MKVDVGPGAVVLTTGLNSLSAFIFRIVSEVRRRRLPMTIASFACRQGRIRLTRPRMKLCTIFHIFRTIWINIGAGNVKNYLVTVCFLTFGQQQPWLYLESQMILHSYWLHCRSQWPRGVRRMSAAARLLRFWVRIPPGAYMYVSVVCCQIEASATSWSLLQRSPTDCGASLCVWSRNLMNEEALGRWGLSRQRQTKTDHFICRLGWNWVSDICP